MAPALFCVLAATTSVAQSADPLRFCLYVRHTDGKREWSYDVSPLGRLEKGLEEAKAKGWTVVDMKSEWKIIYPFER